MKRVLVVDDDRLVADTLQLVFSANGFEAEATYSAQQGLERARTFAPQLVLTDISMPEKTGLQLAEALAKELPQIRVMMLTAYSSNFERVMDHGETLGKHIHVMSKPVRPEELLRQADLLLSA